MLRISLSAVIISLFLCAYAHAGGIEPSQKTKPVEIRVNAQFDKTYLALLNVLSSYNFPITESDPATGIVATDFLKYKAGIKGFFHKMLLDREDFEMQISGQVVRAGDSLLLRLSGKIRYKEGQNVFKSYVKTEPIHKGTDSYKQLEKLAQTVKAEAEGRFTESANSKGAPVQSFPKVVYVTRSGGAFHNSRCAGKLASPLRPMAFDDAKKKYAPCELCFPPPPPVEPTAENRDGFRGFVWGSVFDVVDSALSVTPATEDSLVPGATVAVIDSIVIGEIPAKSCRMYFWRGQLYAVDLRVAGKTKWNDLLLTARKAYGEEVERPSASEPDKYHWNTLTSIREGEYLSGSDEGRLFLMSTKLIGEIRAERDSAATKAAGDL